jgi:peptidoglycan hydrolase-like protein with peptidoglycan-binding domain
MIHQRFRTLRLAVAIGSAAGIALLGLAVPAVASDGSGVVSLTGCTGRVLRPGMRNECVLSLQHSLNAVGIRVVEDGDYGQQTYLAVQGFQSGNNLQVDGVAGPEMINALDRAANSPPAGPPPGSATASNQSPDGTVSDNMVVNCGNFFGTCTTYYSRSATRAINDALNDPGIGLATDVGMFVVCKKASGDACDIASMFGKYKVADAAQRAVEQNGCIKFKYLQDPMIPTSVAPYDGRNCIE